MQRRGRGSRVAIRSSPDERSTGVYGRSSVGWYATDGSIQLLRGRYPHIRITQVDAKSRARVAALATQLGADKVWLSRKGKKEIAKRFEVRAIYASCCQLGKKRKGERRAQRGMHGSRRRRRSRPSWRVFWRRWWTKPDGRISFGVGFCAGLAADLQEAAIELRTHCKRIDTRDARQRVGGKGEW